MMKSILEFFVVFTVAILPHILGAFFILTNKNYLNSLPPWQRTLTSSVHNVATILLIVYVALNHADGLTAFGLSLPLDKILDTFLISVLATAYLSLIFVVGKLRSKKAQEKREELRRAIFEAGGFSRYRTFQQRTAYLIVLWTGVLAEDLVFRGYLVLGLGSLTGTYWPWILLSVLLSITLHLYQGLNGQVVLSQAFFAVVFIVAVMVTKNVFTAIIPHLVYDTTWILRGWAKDSERELQPLESAG